MLKTLSLTLLSLLGSLTVLTSCSSWKSPASPTSTANPYEQWKAEREQARKLDEQKARERQAYYDQHFREHGYPSAEDRQRAINEALKPASQRSAPQPGPGQTQHLSPR